ncbi:MAG: hypothetical protein K5745_08070, partial [Saccharofermentans sp.]|nr:hypothetical protein [Saccharofermentans sp.]
MKKYIEFVFPRFVVGLLIGIIIFIGVFTYGFKYRYETMVDRSCDALADRYSDIVEKYDSGDIGAEFIYALTNLYRADYVRIAKIEEDGSIMPIVETDYDSIPAYKSINDWINITKNEELIGTVNSSANSNGAVFTVNNVRCDEIWDLVDYKDYYVSNSLDLTQFDSEALNYGSFFYNIAYIAGMHKYNFLCIDNYHIEGDTLHLGQVYNARHLWDFTGENGVVETRGSYAEALSMDGYLISAIPPRPDQFFELYSYFAADNANDMNVLGRHEVSANINGRKTVGYIQIMTLGENRYLVEFVTTAASFTEYFGTF